jgi:hypothetical protein
MLSELIILNFAFRPLSDQEEESDSVGSGLDDADLDDSEEEDEDDDAADDDDDDAGEPGGEM